MENVFKSLTLLMLTTIFSCKSTSSTSLIIGTWVPQNNKFGTSEQWVFTQTKLLSQSIINGKANTETEFYYKISENNKFLTIRELNNEKKVDIIELTNENLTLKGLTKSDTFYFRRK